MKYLRNGEWLEAGEGGPDRSFRLGDGLFETLRVQAGRPLFWEYHLERLREGMEALGISGFHSMTETFPPHVRQLLQSEAPGGSARLRLHVYRRGAGAYLPAANEGGWAMEAFPMEGPAYQAKSVSLTLFEDISLPCYPWSRFKTASALVYVQAARHAAMRGCDDALLLHEGCLAESSAANLFLLHRGRLLTPALSSGCVAGVMRRVTMKLAAEIGCPAEEAELPRSLLADAEEIFLTSSVRGILAVRQIGEKIYPTEGDLLSAQLRNALRRRIETGGKDEG
jgi:branched-chain amino acid aminotransferase